jgi:hypothetical protein
MEFMARQGMRIDILRELPLRARPATAGEVSRIFGGCGGDQAECKENKDCCDGFYCLTSSWFVCVKKNPGDFIYR